MAGRRILTLVALVVCLASGCSDTDSPSDAPDPPSTSDSPNDSPSEQTEPVEADVDAPTMPGGASKDTLKGAEAFVRHYIDLLNYAEGSGDTRALNAASSRCAGCDEYADLFRTTYENGGYMRSDGWSPTSVLAVREEDAVVVLVDVHATRMRYRLRADGEVKIGKSDDFKLRFEVAKRRKSWQVTDFGLQTMPNDA